MKICKNEITDYFSANFTEDEPEWLVGNLYNVGDEARDDHYIYKYAGVDNTNTATKPSLNPIQWKQNRTSNYYAMLGDKTNEQTENPDEIIIEIQSNTADVLALLNVDADTIRVEILGTDYDETIDMSERVVYDWSTFWFAPFLLRKNVYLEIGYRLNVTIRITATKTGGIAKIGRLVNGTGIYLGDSLFGTSFDLQTYTGETTDQFGAKTDNVTGSVFNGAYPISLPSQNVEIVKQYRKDFDNIPILFIGDEQEESVFRNLLSYGKWQKAGITLQDPSYSSMELTIKELL